MRAIADKIGGNSDNIILQYFTRYACPEKQELLLSQVDMLSRSYGTQLEIVMRFLIAVTGDGKGYVPKGASDDDHHHKKKKHFKRDGMAITNTNTTTKLTIRNKAKQTMCKESHTSQRVVSSARNLDTKVLSVH